MHDVMCCLLVIDIPDPVQFLVLGERVRRPTKHIDVLVRCLTTHEIVDPRKLRSRVLEDGPLKSSHIEDVSLLDELCVHVLIRCVAKTPPAQQNYQVAVTQEVHLVLEARDGLWTCCLNDGPLVVLASD